MTKQQVKEINLTIINESKTSSGFVAYFKEFNFKDLIDWVWRNCQGCDNIQIYPEVKIIVTFDDRVEIYTLIDQEIPSNIQLER